MRREQTMQGIASLSLRDTPMWHFIKRDNHNREMTNKETKSANVKSELEVGHRWNYRRNCWSWRYWDCHCQRKASQSACGWETVPKIKFDSSFIRKHSHLYPLHQQRSVFMSSCISRQQAHDLMIYDIHVNMAEGALRPDSQLSQKAIWIIVLLLTSRSNALTMMTLKQLRASLAIAIMRKLFF